MKNTDMSTMMNAITQMAQAIEQMNARLNEVEIAHADATDAPAKVSSPKVKKEKPYLTADDEVIMERDGSVCRPTCPVCKSLKGTGIWGKELQSAIWYVNNELIKDEFGDDVEFRSLKRGQEPGYVCKSVAVAKQLEKFELRNYVTKSEWNAWVDMKVEDLMASIERLEGLKVK